MVFSLRKIIESENTDKASITEALLTFKCKMDEDVQTFLHEKAIDFEEKHQTATFLSINDEKLKSGELQIDGYFSLAIKVFEFSDEISNRKKKLLSGKSDKQVPAFLIGQLARNDCAPKGTGKELLNLAIQYIKNAQNYVGGCLTYLDCKDNMIPYYEKYGFSFIQKSSNEDNLNQMYITI